MYRAGSQRNLGGGGQEEKQGQPMGIFGIGVGDNIRIQQQHATNLYFMQGGAYDVNYQAAIFNAIQGISYQPPQQMPMPANPHPHPNAGNRPFLQGGNAAGAHPYAGMQPNANARFQLTAGPGAMMPNANARLPVPAGAQMNGQRAPCWTNGQQYQQPNLAIQGAGFYDTRGQQMNTSPCAIHQHPEEDYEMELSQQSQLSQCSQRSSYSY